MMRNVAYVIGGSQMGVAKSGAVIAERRTSRAGLGHKCAPSRPPPCPSLLASPPPPAPAPNEAVDSACPRVACGRQLGATGAWRLQYHLLRRLDQLEFPSLQRGLLANHTHQLW